MPVWGELRWLLAPCLLSLKNHWSGLTKEHLIILTDNDIETPLPADCLIYSEIGHNFSGSLKNALERIKTDIIFFVCVDSFLIDQLDDNKLKNLIAYMQAHQDILRGNIRYELALDHYHKFIEEWLGLKIIQCSKWQHCSLIDGAGFNIPLFNRRLLIQVLNKIPSNWTTQEMEQNIDPIIKSLNLYGIGTIPFLAKSIELHTSTYNCFWRFNQLNNEDQELIKQYQPSNINWINHRTLIG